MEDDDAEVRGLAKILKIQGFTAFRAFLSGLNVSNVASKNTIRNVNFDTDEFIYSYVVNECTKNNDQELLFVLAKYYMTLPQFD